MKKSIKPALFFFLLLFTSAALIILGFVGIKLDCEVLVKEKINAEERLEAALNKKIEYTAEYQLLTSEERIVSIAQDELGMIRDSSAGFQVAVSSSEIMRISEMLEAKYE